VFVTIKVWLSPSADLFALRDKEPYFRDALVRAAHRRPYVVKGEYNRIDEARLRAELLREARSIARPEDIASIQIVSQTPQHRLSSHR
jgi:hypothetical protein